MKCEQFLPWLESGGYIRAALARQHARRCESCRAAVRLLDEVKQEFADSDPLPDWLKHAFVNAGETKVVDLPEPADVHPSRAGLLLAALAAVVLIALAPWLFSLKRHADVAEQARDHDSAQPGELRRVGPITSFAVDSAAELGQLEAELAALKTQLNSATVAAERLSVEQELVRVFVDYHRLLAGNDAK